jgi:hypothetical protein
LLAREREPWEHVVILLAENHHNGTGECRCLINGAETWLHSSSVVC